MNDLGFYIEGYFTHEEIIYLASIVEKSKDMKLDIDRVETGSEGMKIKFKSIVLGNE